MKVRINVELHESDCIRRDIDNIIKCLLDGLEDACVLDNDYNVDELHVVRKKADGKGKVVVTIEEI